MTKKFDAVAVPNPKHFEPICSELRKSEPEPEFRTPVSSGKYHFVSARTDRCQVAGLRTDSAAERD